MRNRDSLHLEKWKGTRDTRALQALIEEYSGLVYATSLRITGDVQTAEDVAQECFITLAQRPPRNVKSLGSWLHRVATNRSINVIKQESARKKREMAYHSENAETVEATWDEIEDIVDEIIEELPEKSKHLIVAHFIEGQTHEDISRELGVSRQAATYRIGRGVGLLRNILRRKGHVVGLGGLTAMLKALLAESAPPVLASSISKAVLSSMAAAGGGWWLWLSGLWGKSLMAAGGLATLIAALALLWDTSDSASGRERPQRAAIVENTKTEEAGSADTTGSDVDSWVARLNAGIKTHIEARRLALPEETGIKEEDVESAMIKGYVIDALTRKPIPGVEVTFYPDDAIDFEVISDDEIPHVNEKDREQIRTVRTHLSGAPENIPRGRWELYARIMRFAPDPSEALTFLTDENGVIEADAMLPGKYASIVESDRYVVSGQIFIDLENAGAAPIAGISYVTIYDGAEPQEFFVEVVEKGTVSGRIYDEFDGNGISRMLVSAYLLTENAYLEMKEAETTTSDDGSFEFVGLQPGSYVIRRAEREGIHGEESREIQVAVGAIQKGLDFPVTRGATLTGTVYWGATPAADVGFELHYADVGVDISKTEAEGTKLVKQELSTDMDGRYLVSGIRDLTGIVSARVTLTNGDTRTSKWARNITISDGDFRTIDFHFDVGAASIEGRFSIGGKPISNAIVIRLPKRMIYGEQSTRTDAEGRYHFDDITSGKSRLHFFYPRSYECTGRTVFVDDNEVLVLDVDIPIKTFEVAVKNVPENMKMSWVYITKDDYFLKGMPYRTWLETISHDLLAQSRVLVFGGRSDVRIRIRGIEPGTYTMSAVSYPALGYIGSYTDDLDKIEEFLDGAVLFHDRITVAESGNDLEVDFEKGTPASEFFETILE